VGGVAVDAVKYETLNRCSLQYFDISFLSIFYLRIMGSLANLCLLQNEAPLSVIRFTPARNITKQPETA
jgi:hypothetical protein